MEHQFRIRELKELFGSLVLSPQLPERTSLQQAQGAAKPVHLWPGEAAQEMAGYFDEVLDQVIASSNITDVSRPASPRPTTAAVISDDEPVGDDTAVTDRDPKA